jgi:hypothetical protein
MLEQSDRYGRAVDRFFDEHPAAVNDPTVTASATKLQ